MSVYANIYNWTRLISKFFYFFLIIKLNIPYAKPINIEKLIKYIPTREYGIYFEVFNFFENFIKSNSMKKFNATKNKKIEKWTLIKKEMIKKNNKIDVTSTDKTWLFVANAPLLSNFFLLKKIGR